MRKVLSVVAGVVAGGIAVALIESIGHMLYPPPEGIDVSNPEQLAAIMDQLPIGALFFVVVAWAVGSLVGGFTATKIAPAAGPVAPMLVGAILLALGVVTMIQIPHPVWMWVFSVAVPLPSAWAGYRLARPTDA